VPSPSPRPQHLHLGDLRIETSFQAASLRIDWSGRSNHLDPGTLLNPFLNEASRRAAEVAAAIEMHFEGLEFFNSSTISVIIQYVKDLRAAKVRLEVFYNPHHQWQKIFFDALSMFEMGDGLLKMRPVA
jgi:hypothetical protein